MRLLPVEGRNACHEIQASHQWSETPICKLESEGYRNCKLCIDIPCRSLKRHGAMEKPLVKFGQLIPRKFAMAAMANPLTAPLTSHIMAPVAASCCPCWVEAPPDWPRRSRKRPGEVWLFKTSVDLWSTVMSLMSSIVGLVHPTFSSNINPFGNAESQRVP